MNLNQALQSAKEGNFVRNSYFSSSESLHYYKGKYYYEDGAVVTKEFLFGEAWALDSDWEVCIPKEEVDLDKLSNLHDKSNGYMLEVGTYMDCRLTDKFDEVKTTEQFTIGGSMMIRLSKQDIIDAMNKTFPDDTGCVAVLTQCQTTISNAQDKITTQSLTFGKLLQL